MPSRILLKCPSCEDKLKSAISVLGKKGECKKCGCLFRAPTPKMHHRRRLKQLGIASALITLFVVLPALYMRAAKMTKLKSEEVTRELAVLDSSLQIRDLLDNQALAEVQTRLANLEPPQSNADLVARVGESITTSRTKVQIPGEETETSTDSPETQVASGFPGRPAGIAPGPGKYDVYESGADIAAMRAAEASVAPQAPPKNADGSTGEDSIGEEGDPSPPPPASKDRDLDPTPESLPAETVANESNTNEANSNETQPNEMRPGESQSGETRAGSEPPKDAAETQIAESSTDSVPVSEAIIATGLNVEPREEAVVIGKAHEFIMQEIKTTSGIYFSGNSFARWIKAYSEVARNEYSAVEKDDGFREKGEFETSEEYEAAKKAWSENDSTSSDRVQRQLAEKVPPRTFVVDGLELIDVGGYDADTKCWKVLECVFTNDTRMKVSHAARALSDESVKNLMPKGRAVHQGEQREGLDDPTWTIAKIDRYSNLPIELEKAKRFRKRFDEDAVRVAMVIQFPGEARFAKPSAGGVDRKGDVENVWDFPIALILRKVVIYDKTNGYIFFERELAPPIVDNVETPPLEENLNRLGWK